MPPASMYVQPKKPLIMFQVKFKSDVHGIIEEMANCWHVDPAGVPDTSRHAAKECRKAPYWQDKEHGSNREHDYIPGEGTPAKTFSLKDSQIFHNTKSTEEIGSGPQRRVICSSFVKVQERRSVGVVSSATRRQARVKPLSLSSSQRNKTLKFSKFPLHKLQCVKYVLV